MAVKYFLFSNEQMKDRSRIEAKLGKRFKVGTVIVDGVRKPYTEISDKPKNRYSDTKIVVVGDTDKLKYTEPRGE